MKDELIQYIQRDIDAMRLLEAEIAVLPELEGVYHVQNYEHGSVIICQPLNWEMFERNKAILEGYGWKCDDKLEIRPFCGNSMPAFKKSVSGHELTIHMHLESDAKGATCKKVLIGYEQQPIYEVTCLEAQS